MTVQYHKEGEWWVSPFNVKPEVTSKFDLPKKVEIHDATLRDGEQTPGVKEHDVSLLTLRQIEVLSRVCQGKANKQIATELGLSEKTVKAHVTAIFKVLGVANRTQAALAARSVGVVFAS